MRSKQATSYKLIERPIYGSSRVGIDNTELELFGYTAPTSGILTHELGLKQYEFSNHLGNVLTTVSDKKIPVDVGNDGTIDWYVADITSATDYYPFGSPMDGRTFSSDKYRFGFNGKEKDDELKGEGNSLDFGGRIYDTRLGRWLSLDPLMAKYPSKSPYNFVGNNPIMNIDPDGQVIQIAIYTYDKEKKELILQKLTYKNGKLYDSDNKAYEGNSQYAKKVLNHLNGIKNIKDPILTERMDILEKSDKVHTIMMVGQTKNKKVWNNADPDSQEDKIKKVGTGSTVGYDPDDWENKNSWKTKNKELRNPICSLVHELLGHSYNYDQGEYDGAETTNGIKMEEVKAVVIENIMRKFLGTKIRTTYGEEEIPSDLLEIKPKLKGKTNP